MSELSFDAIERCIDDFGDEYTASEAKRIRTDARNQLFILLGALKWTKAMAEQLADSGEHKRECKGPDCNCGWYDLIQLCYETLDSSPKPGDKQ